VVVGESVRRGWTGTLKLVDLINIGVGSKASEIAESLVCEALAAVNRLE